MNKFDKITNHCEQSALGLTFASWGDRSYQDIIVELAKATYLYELPEDIVIWSPLEEMTASELLDHLMGLSENFGRCAVFAIQEFLAVQSVQGVVDNA